MYSNSEDKNQARFSFIVFLSLRTKFDSITVKKTKPRTSKCLDLVFWVFFFFFFLLIELSNNSVLALVQKTGTILSLLYQEPWTRCQVPDEIVCVDKAFIQDRTASHL